MNLPPLAAKIADRMLGDLDRVRALTPGQLKTYQLLKAGDPAPIAARVTELENLRALSPSQLGELKELKDALAQLKQNGWTPTSPPGGSEGWKAGTTARGLVDRIQERVDSATTATGVGSLATTATGIGAPVGVVANVVSNVGDLANALVDVGQAAVAAAKGDFAEAGLQIKDAGLRGLGAIPVIGDAAQAARAAAKTAKAVGGAVKATDAAGTAVGAAAKNADEAFRAARQTTLRFPELSVSGPSHSRQFRAAGQQTVIRGEDLIGNSASGIGNTTARMFEDALHKSLKADPALAKDVNAFQEAYSRALGKLNALDRLRPANGQMTQQTAIDAAKRYTDAVAELKKLPVEPGSGHAEMVAALEKARDAVTEIAQNWKPGLKTVQLSAPQGPIFGWLR